MTQTLERRELRIMPGPQWDFVFSEARHPAMFSGRRGGKTVASVVKAFIYCGKFPGTLGCLTAPTYRNVEDIILKAIYDIFGETVRSQWTYHHNEQSIRFQNGSKILLRPADEPDKLRGLTLDFFGMDEAGIGNQAEAFQVLQPTILTKSKTGYPHQGWVTTTPTGINSWLYQRWVKRELTDGTPVNPGQYPMWKTTTFANFHLDESETQALKESYGKTKFSQQELMGEFVAFEGQAFPDFSEKTHVHEMPVGHKVRRSVTGMDWGSIRPTAIVECHLDFNNTVWVTKEFYRRRCTESELYTALGEFPPRVFCDPAAKDVIDFTRRTGVNIRKAKSNDFNLRTRLVGARIALQDSPNPYAEGNRPGIYISPSCTNLIDELSSLAYAKIRGTDMMQGHWQPGMDDHAFDALGYALMEIDAGARGRPQPSVTLGVWGHSR